MKLSRGRQRARGQQPRRGRNRHTHLVQKYGPKNNWQAVDHKKPASIVHW